jgi:hypothetical protein
MIAGVDMDTPSGTAVRLLLELTVLAREREPLHGEVTERHRRQL